MALFKSRWAQILGIGIILFALANLILNITHDVLYFPTIMMLGAFLVPAAFVAYFYQQENKGDTAVHTKSILPPLLLCALFGGLIGTLAAGTLEYATLSTNKPLTLAWVDPIEEFAKLIVPIFAYVILRKNFRTQLDGILFGVVTGMSFTALETMGYELVALINSQGNLATLDQTILIRGLLSPATHAAWTGLITATLWRERERTGKAFTPMVLGFFLIAAGLHTLWDLASFSGSALVIIPAYVIIGGVSLTLLFWRLHNARRSTVQKFTIPQAVPVKEV